MDCDRDSVRYTGDNQSTTSSYCQTKYDTYYQIPVINAIRSLGVSMNSHPHIIMPTTFGNFPNGAS